MQFIFKRKNENIVGGYDEESVELERWGWGVVYKDGTELHQFGAEGDFHQFQEINQKEVEMFTMYRTDDITKRIDIVVEKYRQFFHFYRNLVLENGTRKVKIYVFGWENKVTNAKFYHYILPDDRIITSDHDIHNLQAFNL